MSHVASTRHVRTYACYTRSVLLTTNTKQEQIPPVAYAKERKASHERMTCPYHPKTGADRRCRELL